MRWQGTIPLNTPTIDGRILTSLSVRYSRPPRVYFTFADFDNVPIGTIAAVTAHPDRVVFEIDVPRRDGRDVHLEVFWPTLGLRDTTAERYVDGVIELEGEVAYLCSTDTPPWPDHPKWARVT